MGHSWFYSGQHSHGFYSTVSNYTFNASKILVKPTRKPPSLCWIGCGKDPENYGVVSMDGQLVKEIVEKPSRENAPSNLVLCGRYLFTADTADLLQNTVSRNMVNYNP